MRDRNRGCGPRATASGRTRPPRAAGQLLDLGPFIVARCRGTRRFRARDRQAAGLFRRLAFRLTFERRHHLAREPPQIVPRGAAAIQQDVFHALIAQPSPACAMMSSGRAEQCALSSFASRVSENAMMLAVLLLSGRWLIAGSRRLRGHAAFDRRLLFRRVVAPRRTRAPRRPDRRIEAEPVLHHRACDRMLNAVAPSLDRGELIQQQVVAARRHPADRVGMAGALPERRMRLLNGRRLDDDVVELPVLAVEAEPLVRRPGLRDDVDGFLEARLGLPPSECGSWRIRCAGSPCRCRNPAGRRTADRRSPLAPPAAPGCATAARSPPCPAAACVVARRSR